jgi:2-amino-4-hydroxy-6-hydroxymethyldihydropteridine diphosphokinase
MANVFLGLGSNLGDRIKNIREALGLLEKSEDMKLVNVSSLYETTPVGLGGQSSGAMGPEFINCVAHVETDLDPHTLLDSIKFLETALGRKPNTHFRARSIDIDILLYDEVDLESLDLVIPHTRLKSRRFALEPLLEIEPGACDPISGKPYRDFLDEVKSQPVKKVASSDEVWNGPGRSAKD